MLALRNRPRPTEKAERPKDAGSAGNVSLVVATALAVAAGAAFIGGMVIMGVMMAGHMGGGMMWGGGSNSPQTPIVASTSQVMVEIRDFDYFPRDLTVGVGTQVTWVNRDAAPHTATDKGDGWDTSILNEGQSATLTFDAPGTYNYFCAVHPNMTAALTVS